MSSSGSNNTRFRPTPYGSEFDNGGGRSAIPNNRNLPLTGSLTGPYQGPNSNYDAQFLSATGQQFTGPVRPTLSHGQYANVPGYTPSLDHSANVTGYTLDSQGRSVIQARGLPLDNRGYAFNGHGHPQAPAELYVQRFRGEYAPSPEDNTPKFDMGDMGSMEEQLEIHRRKREKNSAGVGNTYFGDPNRTVRPPPRPATPIPGGHVEAADGHITNAGGEKYWNRELGVWMYRSKRSQQIEQESMMLSRATGGFQMHSQPPQSSQLPAFQQSAMMGHHIDDGAQMYSQQSMMGRHIDDGAQMYSQQSMMGSHGTGGNQMYSQSSQSSQLPTFQQSAMMGRHIDDGAQMYSQQSMMGSHGTGGNQMYSQSPQYSEPPAFQQSAMMGRHTDDGAQMYSQSAQFPSQPSMVGPQTDESMYNYYSAPSSNDTSPAPAYRATLVGGNMGGDYIPIISKEVPSNGNKTQHLDGTQAGGSQPRAYIFDLGGEVAQETFGLSVDSRHRNEEAERDQWRELYNQTKIKQQREKDERAKGFEDDDEYLIAL